MGVEAVRYRLWDPISRIRLDEFLNSLLSTLFIFAVNTFHFSCLGWRLPRPDVCNSGTVSTSLSAELPQDQHTRQEERMRATRSILCCLLLLASTAAFAQTTASLTGTATYQGKGLPD